MIITPQAYQNLIQVQWEARKDEHSADVARQKNEWGSKITAQLGVLATNINNNSEDHSILADIVTLADYTRSFFWRICDTSDDFQGRVNTERQLQDIQWGYQVHSRHKWFLILAEEVGEVSEALDQKKPDTEITTELIQLSAVLQAWVTSRDWFYPPQTPHVTGCKKCGTAFETKEGQLIKCPECETQHDCFGNIVENYNPNTRKITGE